MTPSRSAPPLSRRTAGFTLFAALLALLALALAAYIALAEIGKLRHRAKRTAFVAELRTLAAVFESYRERTGDWPAATTPELRIPRGLEAALADTRWLAGSPLGGSYDWVPPAKPKLEDKVAATEPAAEAPPPPPAPPAMIAVSAFSNSPPLVLDERDLLAIDAELDDGNLVTGRFRTGFNRWPVYLVAPRP
jgi:type II secretory pathway pseudopilin PulG